MSKSESIQALAVALLKAQKEIGAAKKGAENPFFHSTYADLGAVMEACKDALNTNGISVLQPVGSDELGVYVETILLHESGEYIADRMRISQKEANNPQAQGSAITYARRYSLQSMVFIPAEDDDAEVATAPLRKPASVKKTTQDEEPPLPDAPEGEKKITCEVCGEPAEEKKGLTKAGKQYHGIFCSTKDRSHTRWLWN